MRAGVPLLTRVTPHIGHFQIRNRGTLGGAVAHGDPAGEYPTVALDAGRRDGSDLDDGTRRIPGSRILHRTVGDVAGARRGPDRRSAFRSGARAAGSAFHEFARRHGDFAIAGATVAVELDDADTVTPVRHRADGPWLDAAARRGRRSAMSSAAASTSGIPTKSAKLAMTGLDDGAQPICRVRRSTASGWVRRWSPAPSPMPYARRPAMHELPIEMTVNGRPVEAVVEPRLTLADFLRETLRADRHPPGLRARCVRGVHGAGQRRRGAVLPGLRGAGPRGGGRRPSRASPSADGELSPVQAAMRECHGLQCGFCTPGFVMSITALLRDNPHPPTKRSAKVCPATSAGAPATRASSTPCTKRRRDATVVHGCT